MIVKEYITTLETNAMVLGIVSLGLKDLVEQVIRQVTNHGTFDDTGFAAIRAICIRNLKDIQAEGAPLEQEATALNEGLKIFQQMMDDAVARGRAQHY